MISIMNSLEMRFFDKNEVIAKEMDEANEIIFVDNGYYDVGYEINKKKYMRRTFGESTTIGGFQVSYNKRYMFLYLARTYIQCYAIRK